MKILVQFSFQPTSRAFGVASVSKILLGTILRLLTSQNTNPQFAVFDLLQDATTMILVKLLGGIFPSKRGEDWRSPRLI